MASPFNASESESADEIIETGFDPLLFWDQNRQAILLVAGVLLLTAIGFAWYEVTTSQRLAAAESALASASKPEDFQQVIDKYPGTVAAGDASLLLAGQLRRDKKYDEAVQVLQTFLSKYPAHPLASAGQLSLGETLELQNKGDEAQDAYQQVITKYPDSFSAPMAALAQANLLKAQGKIEDARRVYQNFASQFPDSIFANESMAEMHLLRAPAASMAPASAAPSPQSSGSAAFSAPAGLPSAVPLPPKLP